MMINNGYKLFYAGLSITLLLIIVAYLYNNDINKKNEVDQYDVPIPKGLSWGMTTSEIERTLNISLEKNDHISYGPKTDIADFIASPMYFFNDNIRLCAIAYVFEVDGKRNSTLTKEFELIKTKLEGKYKLPDSTRGEADRQDAIWRFNDGKIELSLAIKKNNVVFMLFYANDKLVSQKDSLDF